MRTVRILGLVVGGVIALLAALLIGVWLFVNPNNYKGRISAAVQDATGRELKLPGDIKLSVFPWIALELGPASLGNLPGFGDEPFLSFDKAAVRVKLLPLLAKELEVDRIELDGLDLRLKKNAAGQGNWSDPNKKPAPAPAAKGGSSARLQSLAHLDVKSGRVSYQDIVISNFNLETGSVAGFKDMPVTLGFDAAQGKAGEAVTLNAKFTVSDDAATQDLQIGALSLSGTVSRPGDARPVPWELTVPKLDVNLDKQTLAMPSFAASFASLKLNGSLSGTKIIDDLRATGSLSLLPLVLREFAPRLGIALPVTRDSKALSQLSASTEFSYDAKAMALEKMQIRLDDSTLKGDIKVGMGETPAVKFDLAADKIDLDRYRAPAGAPPAPEAKKAEEKPSKSKPMTLEGSMSLAAAHVASLDFTNIRVVIAAKDGVTHLAPLQAQLYGGQYSGDVTLDSRTPVTALNLESHLTGVDMAKLLANTAQKGRLSGKANVNLKVTARGAEADAITKTLNGNLDANLADGAVEGLDVMYELGQVQALINQKPAPAGINSKRTKFDVFKDSVQIVNGVAETKDLNISSSVLKVTGQGSANLPSKAIDFKVLASVFKSATTTAVDIPLKITGTYDSPTVRPDLEDAAKQQLKNKLQDVLKKNGLKDLFK